MPSSAQAGFKLILAGHVIFERLISGAPDLVVVRVCLLSIPFLLFTPSKIRLQVVVGWVKVEINANSAQPLS